MLARMHIQVRGSLLLEPACPECTLQIVSLPRACAMVLRPHTDAFAAALAQHGDGDVRATLTELINRFPAIASGTAITLIVGRRCQVHV